MAKCAAGAVLVRKNKESCSFQERDSCKDNCIGNREDELKFGFRGGLEEQEQANESMNTSDKG